MLGKAGAWQGGRQGLVCVIYVWLRWVFTAAQPSLSLCERGLVIAVAYFVAEHRLRVFRLSR